MYFWLNSVVNMGLLEPGILNNTESLMLINMSHVLSLAIAFNRQANVKEVHVSLSFD